MAEQIFLHKRRNKLLILERHCGEENVIANGCLVPEESSSTVSFEEGLSLNSDHSSAILNELPVHEGVSCASSLSQSGSEEKLPNVSPNESHWCFETSRQGTCFYNGDNVNITNCPDSDSDSNIIRCMDASYTSDSDCSSSSDTDYCSSETDLPTSSDESDMEEPDKSNSGISIKLKNDFKLI